MSQDERHDRRRMVREILLFGAVMAVLFLALLAAQRLGYEQQVDRALLAAVWVIGGVLVGLWLAVLGMFVHPVLYPIQTRRTSEGWLARRRERDDPLRERLDELERLGFAPIGLQLEGIPWIRHLVLASERHAAWANVSLQSHTLYYFTHLDGGRFVLSADKAWPGLRDRRAVVQCFPGEPASRVLAAHEARLVEARAGGSAPLVDFSLAARAAAARAWYRGPGRAGLRSVALVLLLPLTVMAGAFVVKVVPALLGRG